MFMYLFILEKGTSNEKMPPQEWPGGKPVVHFLIEDGVDMFGAPWVLKERK